jgi:protein PhnA
VPDTVSILKDLKVPGASGDALKVGTKVRGIRLIDDVGSIQLKSSVVKKV